MLARQHRVTSGADYRRISRRGRRARASGLTVFCLRRDAPHAPTRFGFIITKRVGVAVVRNTVRRRLKAIAYELLPEVPSGADLVIRVFPEAASLSFAELHEATRASVFDCVKQLGFEGCAAQEATDAPLGAADGSA